MRGKSSVRSATPIKARRNNQNDTCQSDNCFLTIPVLYPTTVTNPSNNLNEQKTRARSHTLAVPPASNMSSTPIQKSNRSNSLENDNIQSSTFQGLTTPQSQLMKVLYLSEKNTPTNEPIPSSYKEINHLTVAGAFNSSASSSSCDSLLSLTFSSNPQTPTIPEETEEPQSPKEDPTDSVISEGKIISSMFVEIVRYLIVPFLDFLIYLIGLIDNEDKINTPTINVIKASGSNCSTKLANHVGDLIHNHFNPPEVTTSTTEKKKVKEISFQIPEDDPISLIQQLSSIRKNLKMWLSTHKKTVFTRNGKSCRALVRNEVKHLNTLATSEFSQAKSLTDLIDYWKKSLN